VHYREEKLRKVESSRIAETNVDGIAKKVDPLRREGERETKRLLPGEAVKLGMAMKREKCRFALRKGGGGIDGSCSEKVLSFKWKKEMTGG